MKPVITTRRIYEGPETNDGCRILVDRLWPRGVTKEKAALTEWAKYLAPSTELRKWYDHSAELWPEFQKKYLEELKANSNVAAFVNTYKREKHITLLYSVKSPDHNHALVLKLLLEQKM